MVEQDAVNIKVARSSRAGGANFNGVVISTWQSACFTFMRLGVRVAPTPPILCKGRPAYKRRCLSRQRRRRNHLPRAPKFATAKTNGTSSQHRRSKEAVCAWVLCLQNFSNTEK